ncbi:DNA polymerase III delta prime subunit [Lysinibacillus composti]|nr:DNA polymerase III subunit delta' [Lysinibacillus composti]MBM7607271.1 DNA polymerase III delta prime subunit [Lysinibacillus composti]
MSKQLFENLIQTNRLSHAYFLEGGNGEDFALWLSSRILCEGHDEEECLTCRRIYHYNHPDVVIIRPEGLAIKVDQIRALHEKAAYKSADGNGQVFIIVGADKMNPQASNALLKFLEEPKPDVTILLLGESRELLLETIKSRVQVVRLPEYQGFMKSAIERGLTFESLGLFEEIHATVEQAEEYKEVADKWVATIRDTFDSSKLQALQKVQTWEKLFEGKEQRNLCLRLVQSYVKALFSEKKGAYHLWGNVPNIEWSHLVQWGKALDELTRGLHSNGHFTLQLENFAKKVL